MRITPHSRMKQKMALALVNRDKHSAGKKKSTFIHNLTQELLIKSQN